MTDLAPAVEIHGLSKVFPLRRRKMAAGLATDKLGSLASLLTAVGRRGSPSRAAAGKGAAAPLLKALDDVTLRVMPGEVVGIIGRNGAGKSTLLKILARVLRPSAGRVTIRGRVVSLLEMGMGFSPEMTLHENIHLFGRLAGLRTRSIQRAEAAILDFAGLTAFADVPLDHCPSGSYIRLAFSAMVNLEADVILADEILAVGDSAFRKTCEERIRAAGATGEAVLFVSHDMNAIRRICTRTVWIDCGRIRQVGETGKVVDAYTADLLSGQAALPPPDGARDLGSACRLLDVRLLSADGDPIGALPLDAGAVLDCLVRLESPRIRALPVVELWRGKWHVFTALPPAPLQAARPTTLRAGVRLAPNYLNEESYTLVVKLLARWDTAANDEAEIVGEGRFDFTVVNLDPKASNWADWRWGRPGVLGAHHPWHVAPLSR